MGKRVRIHCTSTSRADMNGKCGVATDFHVFTLSRSCYTVQLDSGETVKVKSASLHLISGRAEGKGKGKKGKKGRNKRS